VISATNRLFTWADVESAIDRALDEKGWPEWLVEVFCYWDGLTVTTHPVAEDVFERWIVSMFGPRLVKRDALSLSMEALAGEERLFPIVREDADDSDESKFDLRLSFELPTRLRKPADIHVPFDKSAEQVAVIAFHSFKGGVGRTTAALSLATTLSTEPFSRKVLLVDADLEAPGITFMLDERLPEPPFSLADLLALVHGDPEEGQSKAIGLAASRLADSIIDGITILPAFRSANGYEAMAIRPEHFTRHAKDPFAFASLLRRLALQCGCDTVVVDLRAGISEVAAGLLLDPSVRRVFVTSLGGQSVRGTASVLRRVVRFDALISRYVKHNASATWIVGESTLLISQVRNEDAQRVSEAESQITSALSAKDLESVGYDVSNAVDSNEVDPSDQDEMLRSPLIRTLISPYDGNLVALPRFWKECIERIARSPIKDAVRSIAEFLNVQAIVKGNLDVEQQRSELNRISQRMEYAESGEGEDFLATQPIVNIASDHRSEPPAIAVVGAKGAGKSFMFLQMTRTKRWASFLRACNVQDGKLDALVWPLLQPVNLQAAALDLVTDAREASSQVLGVKPRSTSEIIDRIRLGLQACSDESAWRQHWLDAIAYALGFESKGGFEGLVDAVVANKVSLIITIDGLEDLFQDLWDREDQKTALRALLQDVIAWIGQIPGRPIGLVVFVRRDMVITSIKQNSAQYLSRFRPYELKWNPNEALRLVLWLWYKIKGSDVEVVPNIPEVNLAAELSQLWGIKLGSATSREAYSHEWVLSVLSDFRGQVQARDVMRLLRVASHLSLKDERWLDRVITPSALRKAPQLCGQEKVEEIGQESPLLRQIFDALRKLPHERRVVPFWPSETSLTAEQVDLLERNGVLLREEDGYYMPEMFRHGLGFTVPRGARPRVLALARRARATPA
jgi:MinD-like ATPase involved in chromosome partitioning or flagellar assembly